jgi:hypothetical protein
MIDCVEYRNLSNTNVCLRLLTKHENDLSSDFIIFLLTSILRQLDHLAQRGIRLGVGVVVQG